MFAWRESFSVSTRGRPTQLRPESVEEAGQRQDLNPHPCIQIGVTRIRPSASIRRKCMPITSSRKKSGVVPSCGQDRRRLDLAVVRPPAVTMRLVPRLGSGRVVNAQALQAITAQILIWGLPPSNNIGLSDFTAHASTAATALQEAKVFSSRFASMPPAAPMATIRVRGARSPHSSSTEMSTRRPTTCKTTRRRGASVE